MGRPAKTAAQCRGHRTKAELEARQSGENSLLSGESMIESSAVKSNDFAHGVFLRVRKLFRSIEKNDALYEQSINRYALLAAECEEFQRKRELFHQRALSLDQKFEDQDYATSDPRYIRPVDYFRTSAQLQAQVIACDKQIQSKRNMMLAIEKESCMTISSALRAIPKTPPDESQDDPMADMIARRRMHIV